MSDKLVRAHRLIQKFRSTKLSMNRLEGEMALVKRNLKRDFQISTLQEAESLYSELNRKREKIDRRIEQLVDELEEELEQ